MSGNLQGKKIIITGATSGLGLAMAKAVAAAGASVLITGRSEEKIHNAVEETKPK